MSNDQGESWVSHDKGSSSCIVDLDGQAIRLQTMHSIPFRKFEISPLHGVGAAVAASMNQTIDKTSPRCLVQGDLNYQSSKDIIQDFDTHFREAGGESPTTPRGRIYDHICYRGITLESVSVDTNVLTDHYPVIAEFSL